MSSSEPTATAVLLLVVGALMATSVILSRVSTHAGIPVVVLFLALGMLAGSEGIGRVQFEDYDLSFRLGCAALVMILFDGGLNSPLSTVRRWLAPATVLATVGVVVTGLIVAVGAHLLGFAWLEALLLGAIVSSTDAAAVFSVLRGGGVRLEERVGATLELESGLNDPMAVILTVAVTETLMRDEPLRWSLVLVVVMQLVIGLLAGIIIGFGSRYLLVRLQLSAGGLYPVLTTALAFLAYGLTTLVGGSGFLAVYVAGVLLGNGLLPYRSGLLRVHEFLGWASQVLMFLVLGLLVLPSRLLAVSKAGFLIALLLAIVARPVAVTACLLPFRYPAKEIFYIGWVGLRGAVPVILALIPVLAGVSHAGRIFDVVFFVVVLSALLQGGSVRWLTAKLGFESRAPPPSPAVLEIASTRPLASELMAFHIAEASAVCGARVCDLPFPEGAAVMLIVRGHALLAPRPVTVLNKGDHVYVFCHMQDRAFVQLLFGRREDM